MPEAHQVGTAFERLHRGRRVLLGLQRRDLFTVVFDQVFTDTARYADVVLPATAGWAETDGTTASSAFGNRR